MLGPMHDCPLRTAWLLFLFLKCLDFLEFSKLLTFKVLIVIITFFLSFFFFFFLFSFFLSSSFLSSSFLSSSFLSSSSFFFLPFFFWLSRLKIVSQHSEPSSRAVPRWRWLTHSSTCYSPAPSRPQPRGCCCCCKMRASTIAAIMTAFTFCFSFFTLIKWCDWRHIRSHKYFGFCRLYTYHERPPLFDLISSHILPSFDNIPSTLAGGRRHAVPRVCFAFRAHQQDEAAWCQCNLRPTCSGTDLITLWYRRLHYPFSEMNTSTKFPAGPESLICACRLTLSQVSIGDTMTIAVASGTAVHLSSLPVPPMLHALRLSVRWWHSEAHKHEHLLPRTSSE